MRRFAAAALLLGMLSGCMGFDTGVDSGGMRPLQAQGARPVNGGPPSVPGVQGANGLPVPMAAPYSYAPPMNEHMARMMMAHSVPLSQTQMNGAGGMPGMPMTLSPPGLPGAPGSMPGGGTMPTGSQLMTPGPGMAPDSGIQQAQFAMNPASAGVPQAGMRTQVRFSRPVGMQVSWFAMGADGKPMFSPTPIDTPGKYNFLQAARYRLKLTNIPGRPGLELYPTLEVVPANAKAEAFLAHSSVPLEFTEDDFKQVADGNYLVKVVYLPDPNFQDVAGTGTDEIVSTKLEPGQDPIQEALRRGSILLVVRMGNIDQEAPNTPPLTGPTQSAGPPLPGGMPQMGMPQMGMPQMGMPPFGVPPMGGPPMSGAPGMAPGGTFGPTQPGITNAPLQVPFWGMGPQGPFLPPGAPPGAVPPGLAPPPASVPPGALPPGGLPPSFTPPPGGLGTPPVAPPTKQPATSSTSGAPFTPFTPSPLVPPPGVSSPPGLPLSSGPELPPLPKQ